MLKKLDYSTQRLHINGIIALSREAGSGRDEGKGENAFFANSRALFTAANSKELLLMVKQTILYC